MCGLQREDEQKLNKLTELCASVGYKSLPEDDQLVMLYLEDLYYNFLEEGLQKLRGEFKSDKRRAFRSFLQRGLTALFSGNAQRQQRTGGGDCGGCGADFCEKQKKTAVDGKHDGLIVSSLAPPAKVTDSLQPRVGEVGGKLWTWVLDDVAVGGVPYAAGSRDSGKGHIFELWRQCVARGGGRLFVVSCMESGESVPAGFATLESWGQLPCVVDFYTVPFIFPAKLENPPEVDDQMLDTLLTICSCVYQTCSFCDDGKVDVGKDLLNGGFSCSLFRVGKGKQRHFQKYDGKRIVYIMCKTGYTRGWVFAMAYFMSQHGMGYDEADDYLRKLRPFDPSDEQIKLVLKFFKYISEKRCVKRSKEEEEYIALLTRVLSLSSSYRERLLRDLDRLV